MAEINFFGRVDRQNVDSLIQHVETFINSGTPLIDVNFGSPGGNIEEGARGYDVLSKHRDKLRMNNLRNTDSAAILLFCSGSDRTCNRNGTFLIHSASDPTFNHQTATRVQIFQYEQNIAKLNVVQAHLINDVTGVNFKQLLNWIYTLPNGKTIAANVAHRKALVHTINILPKVSGANSVTIQ